MKLLRKACCMMVFAVMAGSVYYYLKCKDGNGREKGCILADEFKEKKEQIKEAAGDIKDDMSDIKDSAKAVFMPAEEDEQSGANAGKSGEFA